jgi:hypothetical protein
MNTDLDSSSVALSYEAKDAACDFRVASECLLLHVSPPALRQGRDLISSHQAFQPSAVSMGAPSEPAITPLVTRPAAPTANDQSGKAYDAWDNRMAPIVFQFASHITGMRASFAREPNEG